MYKRQPLLFLALLAGARAHEGEVEEGVEASLTSVSLTSILLTSFILGVLVLISIFKKRKTERQKVFLFLGIIIPVILATAYIAGATIYLNLISQSQGPVHWHADFEIWKCGDDITLAEPQGISNRIGTSTFHEHGDMRIHVEGVIVNLEDINLHEFIEAIGGDMTDDSITLPTKIGVVEIKNGDMCNGKPGKWQAFLYKVTNPDPKKKSGFTFVQQKLDNFGEYVLSPYSNVPPGDCIVLEFDVEKSKTNHICETYEVAMKRGDITGS